MIRIKKAQLSIEFMLALGLVVFLFFLFFGLMLNKNHDLKVLQDNVDLKKECLRLSNAITSVYKSGSGTQYTTKTKYVINIRNDSIIEISGSGNVSLKDNNKIAIVASESGVSTQTFYNVAQSMNPVPDYYKSCTDDWNPAGGYNDRFVNDCNPNLAGIVNDPLNWNLVSSNLTDLISHIDDYHTIYLEDAHMHKNELFGVDQYYQILKNWVAKGNVLIVSEHFYCSVPIVDWTNPLTNQQDVHYSLTPSHHWVCNPSEITGSDTATGGRFYREFFDRVLYLGYGSESTTNAWESSPYTVIVNNTYPYTFDVGSIWYMSEDNYVGNLTGNEFIIGNGSFSSNNPTRPPGTRATMLIMPYGNGYVHYFPDFEVTPSQQEDFSDKIIKVIQNSYNAFVKTRNVGDALCSFRGISKSTIITGNITIINDNSTIYIKINNATG